MLQKSVIIGAFCFSLLISPGWAQATPYTFIKILERTDELLEFAIGPEAINDSRQIVFSQPSGIWLTSPGVTPQPIALRNPAGPIAFVEEFPAVNNAGLVSFAGRPPTGSARLWQGALGSSPIAVTAGAGSFLTLSSTSINDSGFISFSAVDSGIKLLATKNGGPLTVIATVQGSPYSQFGRTSINNSGQVAFVAQLDAGGRGIFVGNGNTVVTIAQAGIGFSSVGDTVSMNDAGVVAFGANVGGIEGIYTCVPGGTPQLVTDDTGAFNTFIAGPVGGPLINNDGKVVFLAELDGGDFGIFSGPDPILDKVVRDGDFVFGVEVYDVYSLGGINSNGDVAFAFEGRDAPAFVAIAAIPEPVYAPLMLSVLIGLSYRNRKRVTPMGKVMGTSRTSLIFVTSATFSSGPQQANILGFVKHPPLPRLSM